MKILVTGGTGFVGSHTTARLLRAGHDVRLFVRDPGRIDAALTPHHVDVGDVITGDVTDERAVADAVRGCDAVIHGASVYSYDPREAATLTAVNARGTQYVLQAAAAAGCDPIVQVSSTASFLGRTDPVITEDTAVGTEPSPYARSKAESERVARRFQQDGVPVVTSCPGGIAGPHDPHLKELNRSIVAALKLPIVPNVSGARSFPLVDVRDVAEAHVAMMEPGRGPRRYLLVAANLRWTEVLAELSVSTGRSLRIATAPAGAVLAGAAAADRLQSRLKRRLPFSRESVVSGMGGAPFDSSRAREELGIAFRPWEETLRDVVGWLVQAGHLPARRAGVLAARPAA